MQAEFKKVAWPGLPDPLPPDNPAPLFGPVRFYDKLFY